VTQPQFAPLALRSYRSSLGPGLFLIAALATILIAGAYTTHYINAVTPDAREVISEPAVGAEQNVPEATPAIAIALERGPEEPEITAALEAPIPTADSAAPQRATARHRPVTVPATKRASAHQRPAPERRTPVGTTHRGTHKPRAASVGVPVAETSKRPQPDRWQAMEVSLARCSGDLIARFVCDQRVRLQFCEGHWGKAPACASGVANDHGQ
jgi:hypothetical protein